MSEHDRLTEGLGRLAEHAPTRIPSAPALLAAHRRRRRWASTAAGAAASVVVVAGAIAVPHFAGRAVPGGTPGAGTTAGAVVPTPTPTASPRPSAEPVDIQALLRGRDLDQRWPGRPGTRGTLAQDGKVLAGITARAVDLFYKGLPYQGGNILGVYKRQKYVPGDLRILVATDLTSPAGVSARVVLLTGPPDADPPHRAVLWLVGRAGAPPADLVPANCPGPFLCTIPLLEGGLRIASSKRAVSEHLVAGPPGSVVTIEAGDGDAPSRQVVATASPLPGIPGLYLVPAQDYGYAQMVSRQAGRLIWFEPFT